MEPEELLAELETLIKAGCGHLSAKITDAQYAGDHKSGELVVVVEDGPGGGHQEFIISSTHVVPLVDEDDEDPWGNDEEFPRKDWQHEAGENNTSLGYWDWVAHQREAKESEEPDG